MTTTMEQMVIQLQQELFTLKAQVAARVQIAAAVQVVNNLTTAQGRKGAHSKTAEQMTEILKEFIDLEFLPILTNQKREVQNLEFILQQMHTMLTDLTSGEANDMLLPTRRRTPWRRGDDCRRDTILQQEGGRETFFALSFLREDALFWNSKRELNAGSLLCRNTKRCWRIRRTTRSSWLAWRHWSQRSLRNT